ncbi:DUF3471 domain-containing protein [Xanthocytophaga flava]|uniref:DUF3471 domain-containing protein n=1 Tax=Xanthocytophaga flava TaxID=3048013 RepID=UPI0028D8E2DC|nr:DUF3471 domain-containing protein [Xanthocytophaga flavus]MDJ1466819.1 DUF3471 domain-containing protein [Xanthocytophaga flavus]
MFFLNPEKIAIPKNLIWEKISLSSIDLASYGGVYKSETEGERIIAYKDDRLVLYSKGGEKVELVPYAKDRFYLSNQLATLEFTKDITTDSCSFILQSIGTPVFWKRTEKNVQKYSAIPLSVEALKRYTGAYQFVPEFVITITLEGNTLYGKATGRGQMKQEILPYAPDKFFAKNLDATLKFMLNEQGVITGMILFQNGEKKAQKIN